MTIPVLELLRTLLPADPVLVGGTALLIGTVAGFFLTTLWAWARSLVIGLAIRHSILVFLGSVGLSVEALIPGGWVGIVRGALPFL